MIARIRRIPQERASAIGLLGTLLTVILFAVAWFSTGTVGSVAGIATLIVSAPTFVWSILTWSNERRDGTRPRPLWSKRHG